jgi:methanogenic corrinoid protein MtbC1
MPVHRQLLEVLARWDDCSAPDFSEARLDRFNKVKRSIPVPQFKDALEKTVETEIIPRLLLAHRLSSGMKVPAVDCISDEDVAEFTHLVLEHELSVIAAYIDIFRTRGFPVEQIIMQLLAPSARRLGEMWENDERDFVDVTIALSRIQHTLRSLGPAFHCEAAAKQQPRHALLAPTPGEQHTLGIMIVEEFFRRSGWQCSSLTASDSCNLEKVVSSQNFDVIGLSTSCEVFLDNTATAIDTIKKTSKNQQVIVVVGGPLFWQRPELVSQVGADGTAEDGTQALALVSSLCSPKLDVIG